MSRIQQDQFIDDDEEEVCPLCVEEFDLMDKGFKPCPCGYQICQFCYNNIRTQLNGLCPACRRPYEDKNIEWKVITPEEMAHHKAENAAKAKKQAAAKQKEAQKKEADHLNRKHLAGLRVVQKNLVYVTGLSPRLQEQELLEALRGDQYFGQYGKIIKIVVSKAKPGAHPPQSVGVYVTFARKEDAATCIAAVDGSQNGERTLRAQYGTTKYCSAFLRGENCTNRNCMFLHEPGEESESFTRQDLSSLNVIGTQQPGQTRATANATRPPQPQPPQTQQPISAATQPMQREGSGEGVSSPTGSAADGPALPSTANWGNKALQAQTSRRASLATASSSAASPMAAKPEPASHTPQPISEAEKAAETPTEPSQTVDHLESSRASDTLVPDPVVPKPRKQSSSYRTPLLSSLLKAVVGPDMGFCFNASNLSPEDLAIISNFPPLFDPNGGAKRRHIKEQEAERRRSEVESQAASRAVVATDLDDHPEGAGGSLQLGGEPEERHEANLVQQQHAIQPPSQLSSSSHLGLSGLADDISNLNLGRGLTPQQQQQQQQQQNALLQQFRSAGSTQGSGLLNTFQPSALPQGGAASSHARNQSRFSFANESSSSSAAIKPVANAKLMNQQSSMMPQQSGHFNQSQTSQFFPSAVQGPPPGLKTTGTPPMSGGAMFAQGHGFASSSLGFGGNIAGRQDALLREMMQGQRGAASQPSDAQKREYNLSSLLHHPNHQPPVHHNYPSTSTTPASAGPAPGHSLLGFSPYGAPPGSGYADSVASSQKQKKKGKKHRHANTSSSGGGVVDVNVADPSILQARLQQQHQGTASAGGHGLFGAGGVGGQGAGQGGYNTMYGGGFSRPW